MYKNLCLFVLTVLHFGEYIESSTDNWFYLTMNPYHIIGIIAFSTLVYASLVTGLVWLGMPLFYSMVFLYAAALWLMVSMQQRAKQECAGRDRRYRSAEIQNFGSRSANPAFTSWQTDSLADQSVNSNAGSQALSGETIGRITESVGNSANPAKSAEVHISDVREYAEHLHRLRRLRRRSHSRASVVTSAVTAASSASSKNL